MFYTMLTVCKFITVILQDLSCDVCIENVFCAVSAMKNLLPMIVGCC